MNKEQILAAVKELAATETYFALLYDFLTEGSENAEYNLEYLAKKQFKSVEEMILWLDL